MFRHPDHCAGLTESVTPIGNVEVRVQILAGWKFIQPMQSANKIYHCEELSG